MSSNTASASGATPEGATVYDISVAQKGGGSIRIMMVSTTSCGLSLHLFNVKKKY
jgi:hypothetical protein